MEKVLFCSLVLVSCALLAQSQAIIAVAPDGAPADDSKPAAVERKEHGSTPPEEYVVDEVGTWRLLDPDEGMPVGAHVRLDMGGSGERRILVESEAATATLDVKENHSDVDMIERVFQKLEEVDPRFLAAVELKESDPVAYEEALRKLWEQRQEEVEEAIERQEEVNQAIKNMADEVQIMRGKLEMVTQDNATDAEVVHGLVELEWLVQKVDNARDFDWLNGLQIMKNLLGRESSSVRTAAAFVIGSACKHDPVLQNKALELGLTVDLKSLLELAIPFDNRESAKEGGKMLYALSALLGGSQSNQKELASTTFVSTLLDILELPFEEKDLQERVRGKAITLVHDILAQTCGSSPGTERIDLTQEEGNEPATECDLPLQKELRKHEMSVRLCQTLAANRANVEQCGVEGRALPSLDKHLLQLEGVAGC